MNPQEILTVGPEEYPLYERDPATMDEPMPEELENVENTDTVQGLKAVTAAGTGPNVLVATGNDGRLPSSTLAGGTVVQFTSTQTGAVLTNAVAVPYDDSVPENDEGGEVLTRTITPKSATNKIQINGVVYAANTDTTRIVAFICQDSTVEAIAVGVNLAPSVDNETAIPVNHVMDAGTTSATTFKLRVGAAAGTTTVNGQASARKYGGKLATILTITEIKV